ncbi:MAG: N-alpha-acetyl diaminobutyric acid deacetylase DoeB, partial [Mesorhizobium sp.]
MPGQCAAQALREGLRPMSALRPSPIAPTVDFERDGVQHGFL